MGDEGRPALAGRDLQQDLAPLQRVLEAADLIRPYLGVPAGELVRRNVEDDGPPRAETSPGTSSATPWASLNLTCEPSQRSKSAI